MCIEFHINRTQPVFKRNNSYIQVKVKENKAILVIGRGDVKDPTLSRQSAHS
jgi:hypothetical protein